ALLEFNLELMLVLVLKVQCLSFVFLGLLVIFLHPFSLQRFCFSEDSLKSRNGACQSGLSNLSPLAASNSHCSNGIGVISKQEKVTVESTVTASSSGSASYWHTYRSSSTKENIPNFVTPPFSLRKKALAAGHRFHLSSNFSHKGKFLQPSPLCNQNRKQDPSHQNGLSSKSSFNSAAMSTTPVWNPFEEDLLERLHKPIMSPTTVFARVVSPSKEETSEFQWAIEEQSKLYPTAIEVKPHHLLQSPIDPHVEQLIQEKIDRYFEEVHSVFSPADADIRMKAQLRCTSTEECICCTKAEAPHTDVGSQTCLSFPVDLPEEVEGVLRKYYLIPPIPLDEGNGNRREDSMGNTSLTRRKLRFLSGDNDDSHMSFKDAAHLDDPDPQFVSSCAISGNGAHLDLAGSPIGGGDSKRMSVTPQGTFQSPTVSPIGPHHDLDTHLPNFTLASPLLQNSVSATAQSGKNQRSFELGLTNSPMEDSYTTMASLSMDEHDFGLHSNVFQSTCDPKTAGSSTIHLPSSMSFGNSASHDTGYNTGCVSSVWPAIEEESIGTEKHMHQQAQNDMTFTHPITASTPTRKAGHQFLKCQNVTPRLGLSVPWYWGIRIETTNFCHHWESMITPKFSISQTQKFLEFDIEARYASLQDAEVFVEDCDFRFFARPYYLRLFLPKPVVESDENKAEYNADTGHFRIQISKKEEGEVFPDLDMVTSLLTPSTDAKSPGRRPLIEVISGEDDSTESRTSVEEWDWSIDQQVPKESDEQGSDLSSIIREFKYGFAQKQSGKFSRLQDEFSDVVLVRDPEKKSATERRKEREESEEKQFSYDHYLADLHSTPSILEEIFSFVPHWQKQIECYDFTDDEKLTLLGLPRQEYLLDAIENRAVMLGLLDILFAYCYDFHVTLGETSVESSWNIAILSSTLSWFDVSSNLPLEVMMALVFEDVYEVLRAFLRRCLCFPLYRHWELARICKADVISLLRAGRKEILRCLLNIHQLFVSPTCSRPYYILNDLYIRDYCAWVQRLPDSAFHTLADTLENVKVKKMDLGLDVKLWEEAGTLALKAETGETDSDSVTSDEEIAQVSKKLEQLDVQQ
ncbi:unnamed protein product, partial [Darwinula stevensoni]